VADPTDQLLKHTTGDFRTRVRLIHERRMIDSVVIAV
jgi:hypothetical protein